MRIHLAAVLLGFAAIAGGGCSRPGEESPVLMARGRELYRMQMRYTPWKEEAWTKADIALYACERGRFEECLSAFEERFNHHLVVAPKDDGRVEQALQSWRETGRRRSVN